MTQRFVGSPVFREFDNAARKIAAVLFQFGFETSEERKGVGGGTGESSEYFVFVETAKLLGRAFQNFLAKCYLTITRHYYLAIAAYAQNCSGADLLCHGMRL